MRKFDRRLSRRLIVIGGVLTVITLIACDRRQSPQGPTLFRELSGEKTGITFANQLHPTDTFNIIEYLYYYNGGGIAVGDVNNDNLPDLYFTSNQGPNALYLNRGGMRFEDVTKQAGVAGTGGWTTGATMVDINQDGWLDIYVCEVGQYKNIRGRNQLFINNGDGAFSEQAAEYGLDFCGFSTQAAFFDYDRDGDLDCYLLNHSVHSTENYGTAEIRSTPDSLAGDRLYRRDGNRYRDVTATAGIFSSRVGYGLGIAVGDLNDDGWPDLYISNDFHENDYLYYNQGDGTFRESVGRSLGHTSTFSMGSDVADFDNDGRLDLLSLDMKPAEETVLRSSVGADPYNIYRYKLSFGYYYQYPRNMLQWNRGNLSGSEASFSEIGQLAGVDATDWSWAPLFCDLDGDGWKDLFISNGIWQRPNDLDYLRYISNRELQARATDQDLVSHMPPGKVRNFAFHNEGDLRFRDVTAEWGLDRVGCSNGAAYADLDGDGDLDLVLNNLNEPAAVYQNRANERPGFHFLRVRLEGNAGNRFGTGARVTLEAGSNRQVLELAPTRGFLSAVEPVLTFGLDSVAVVDRLTVHWPDGQVQELRAIPADQMLTVSRDTTGLAAVKAGSQPAIATTSLFAAVPGGAGLDAPHRENEAVDFDGESLLPHMLSTQGPRLADGDIDGDGRTDLYICGARGQSGALYQQTGDGYFRRVPLATDPAQEEVDAVFFDADRDGDADLYIVSGGGQVMSDGKPLRDQLLLNDGNGRFQPAPAGALPAFAHNGACVVAFDYDGDGATDLFLGGRSRLSAYGYAPKSYVLHNETQPGGEVRFREVTAEVAPDLGEVGMVTDAAVAVAGPARYLVVVGEWMPVTLFSLDGRPWKKSEIPYSNGWWNTVTAADLNADGNDDLLLGNLGLNADLRATREEPVELYVRDFDQNYQGDPILTYFKQGRRYTYATLDELAKQLTELRKQYPNYADFARDTFGAVFPPDRLAGSVHRVAYTFASAVALSAGGGHFDLRPLPHSAQIAPLYGLTAGDYDGDGITDILAVGNFWESRPSLGRFDASYGHFLRGRGEGVFEEVEPARSGFVVGGQSRDIRLLTVPGKVPLVVVARNNEAPLVFRVGGTVLDQ